MNVKLTLSAAFALTILALSPQDSAANDWPQWRGPDRTDVSKETGLLRMWPDGGPKQIWLYKEAGKGYSGPAIVGKQLFTVGTREDSEAVIALDAETGKELWATKIGIIYTENHGDGPRCTPTVDGDRVYALGGRGDLACLQASDGKKLWTISMKELGGKMPHWGYTESVLVDGQHVVCTPGGSQGAVAALDKMTGQTVWQSKEFTDAADYVSMIPIEHDGAREYVQMTQQSVVGIDAKAGKLLWRSDWHGKTAVIPTPIYNDDLVYISCGYGQGCKEIKLGAKNEASDVFENKTMVNHHGGVILVDGFLYGYSDGKGWVCQNFRSGAEVWASKNLGKGAIAYADGMFYCQEESSGTLVLIEATSLGWKEHGRFKLDPQSTMRAASGKVWTHPVVLNGKLYLRDQENIYCYNVKR